MLVEISKIVVNRDERQRKVLVDVDSLAESIRRHGLLQPIIITKEWVLVAGERRLEAHKQLGRDAIEARFVETLSPIELKILELEENFRRKDLTWQETVLAAQQIHSLLEAQHGDDWSVSQTANHLNMNVDHVYKLLNISREMERNPDIVKAPTINTASNTIARRRAREDEALLDSITELQTSVLPDIAPEKEEEIVTQTNFNEWASNYTGRPFNLLHCDFPYGINFQDSDQGTTAGLVKSYDDSEEVYWNLCKSLANNIDRILYPSAHMVFWFSMKFYSETLDFFDKHTNFSYEEFPLIWTKSDGLGIAPDVNRRPRRVYETALLLWRGDRKLVRLANNSYSAPKARGGLHISVKPVPVLRHFLSMVCDEFTEMLDPTCGSGSSIIAAESLGAKRVQGFDIDPEYVVLANGEIKKQRQLLKLSKEVKDA